MPEKPAYNPDKSLNTKELAYEQLETAREILGAENVFGPEQVKETFGIDLTEIPEIPFSTEVLERAKTLNHMLVLRTDKAPDGTPLSIQKMYNILTPKWKKEHKGLFLRNPNSMIKRIGLDVLTEETPTPGWALVSKEIIPDSIEGKDHKHLDELEQTEVIIDYLRGEAFQGLSLPPEYESAIKEFENQKKRLRLLLNGGDDTSCLRRIMQLQITNLTIPNVSEIAYDLGIHHNITNKYLFSDNYIKSKSVVKARDVTGGVYTAFMDLGYFSKRGLDSNYTIEPIGLVLEVGPVMSRRV